MIDTLINFGGVEFDPVIKYRLLEVSFCYSVFNECTSNCCGLMTNRLVSENKLLFDEVGVTVAYLFSFLCCVSV